MGEIRSPLPAKLFMGLLAVDPALFLRLNELITCEFGPIDLASEVMPWEITDYYREEMGHPIFRKFVFFKNLINPGRLPEIKRFTNGLEEQFLLDDHSRKQRRINIDPGYVTEAKVVLATTKDFSHRVYIGGNIYAEVTLRYSSKEHVFVSLEHTYLDYRSEVYKRLFTEARTILRESLKQAAEQMQNGY